MKGNPKKLYEHFSRGTSIEELKSSYIEMRESWKEQKAKQEKRYLALQDFKHERDQAKGMLKLCEQKREAQVRALELDNLEKWTEVPVAEAQFKKAEKRVEQYDNKLKEAEEREKEKEAELNDQDVGVDEQDRARVL